MRDTQLVRSDVGGILHRRPGILVPALFAGHWHAKAERVRNHKTGTKILLWEDVIENLVVNQGLNDLLDVTLSGATQDTTWFVGLTDGTPTVAAADTLASHGGWVEVTAYDETNRVAWVDAGAASQSISNTASPAVFTINANSTVVGGAFLAGVNTGTSGRLYAAGAFSAGDKDLDDNDTLTVTATFTAAAA
jgi:hypothetical protein